MHAEGERNISRIVVGLDGSEGSRAAARWCADLAGATGARVTAVHGLGKLPGVLIGGPDAVATGLGLSGSRFHSWRAELRSHLERWCIPLLAAAVDYRTELVDDDVVDALLQVAEKEHADLIVVGAQGHGGMVSRLLGGVPYKLAHHAHVPVVIVPSATRAAGEDALGSAQRSLQFG
jgi:nucleotide-binding universal stress UspA family protein